MQPYLGNSLCAISGCGEFIIPQPLLAVLMGRSINWRVYFKPHDSQPCVVMLDHSALSRRFDELRETFTVLDQVPVRWHREFGCVETASLDGAGRLSIPLNMRRFAQLSSHVLVVATGDQIELWNPMLALRSDDEDLAWIAAANLSRGSPASLIDMDEEGRPAPPEQSLVESPSSSAQ